jgi:perosamine synthetase
LRRIPLTVPDLSGNEERYVVDAIRSSWISSTGDYVRRFEREFAAVCGTRAAVSVVNGTAALHLALLALGIGPGDEVIVPALTYVATANAVRYVGADPVFVDVDPLTWCIDPRLLKAKITPRTRGVIAVHVYGHPADMDEILRIALASGLWVLEDAAEAHLARYKGRVVGNLASMAVFSFYGNKILTCGEGGAIVVNDQELERRIRMLRGQGMDPERRYYFPIVGYNYRLTNVACAILSAQLERRDEILKKRRQIFAMYRELLADIPGIGFQPVAPWAEPAPWLFCVTVEEEQFGMTRDEVMRVLELKGIETRPFFIPLHRLPPFARQSRERGAELPVTDRVAATGMNLPTYPQLAEEEIAHVARAIRSLRK